MVLFTVQYNYSSVAYCRMVVNAHNRRAVTRPNKQTNWCTLHVAVSVHKPHIMSNTILRRHSGFCSSFRLTCACVSVGSVGRAEYIIRF